MTPAEYEAEIARLHAFILQVAERLFLAAECLARNAERRDTGHPSPRCGVPLDMELPF